jgi:hypothetical protein
MAKKLFNNGQTVAISRYPGICTTNLAEKFLMMALTVALTAYSRPVHA